MRVPSLNIRFYPTIFHNFAEKQEPLLPRIFFFSRFLKIFPGIFNLSRLVRRASLFRRKRKRNIFEEYVCMLGVLHAPCTIVEDVVGVIEKLSRNYVIVTKESDRDLDAIPGVQEITDM